MKPLYKKNWKHFKVKEKKTVGYHLLFADLFCEE